MTQAHDSLSRSELKARRARALRRPHASAHAWKLAVRPAEIDLAQLLRCRCLVEENRIPVAGRRIPREVSHLDLLPTTKHILAYRGEEAIGTLRLALPNGEVAAATQRELGLEDEDIFDFSPLVPLRGELGEVARVALLKSHQRGLGFSTLFAGLVTVARRLGVRWLVGTVDCRTFSPHEGAIMYRVAAHRGLVHEHHRVTPREKTDAHELGADASQARFYTPEQRQRAASGALEGLALSGALEIFCRAMGARVLGPPAPHPHFKGRLVMPVLADLWSLPDVMRRAMARTGPRRAP